MLKYCKRVLRNLAEKRLANRRARLPPALSQLTTPELMACAYENSIAIQLHPGQERGFFEHPLKVRIACRTAMRAALRVAAEAPFPVTIHGINMTDDDRRALGLIRQLLRQLAEQR